MCVCFSMILNLSYRSNLIRNMYEQYTRTGYIWEQYDDELGSGKVRDKGHTLMCSRTNVHLFHVSLKQSMFMS